jgi:hypothetical protein
LYSCLTMNLANIICQDHELESGWFDLRHKVNMKWWAVSKCKRHFSKFSFHLTAALHLL